MRDKAIVPDNCGYVVTGPSQELLADVATCPCDRKVVDRSFVVCAVCGTCWGDMRDVGYSRGVAANRKRD